MSCDDDGAHRVLISECGFDDATLRLLQISRFYFTSYAAGETPNFEIAVAMCSDKYGANSATEIAVGMLCVLGAMRRSRKSMFRYNSNTCRKCCKYLSECERLLFKTIDFVRRKERSRAYVTAMLLCEGNTTESLMNSIENLISHLNHAELLMELK